MPSKYHGELGVGGRLKATARGLLMGGPKEAYEAYKESGDETFNGYVNKRPYKSMHMHGNKKLMTRGGSGK